MFEQPGEFPDVQDIGKPPLVPTQAQEHPLLDEVELEEAETQMTSSGQSERLFGSQHRGPAEAQSGM